MFFFFLGMAGMLIFLMSVTFLGVMFLAFATCCPLREALHTR
jgi:hypothetical protein